MSEYVYVLSLEGLSGSDLSLHVSDAQDIRERSGTIDTALSRETLDNYYFITCRRPELPQPDVHLLGHVRGSGPLDLLVTSAVQVIDLGTGRVRTRNGGIYGIEAPAEDEPDELYVLTARKIFRPDWHLVGWGDRE